MLEQDRILEALGIVPSLISPSSIALELDEHNERAMDLAREKKILGHIAQCGSFFYRPDPSNGRRLIAYEVACGYWRRGCKRCLGDRARNFETRFDRCIADTDGGSFLGLVQLTKKQAASMTKRMRKAGTLYWRIPIPEGGILLIFDSLHFSELDNPELHEPIDWVSICQTPKGSRYSGDLGREVKAEKDGLAVKIPQFKFNMELDSNVINSAWSLALKNTEALDPSYDVEEIEECLQARMDSFEDAVIEMGGEIVEKYRVMTRVKEKNFGWKIEYTKIQSTLDTICPEPPPGFTKESPIDYERLKSELWPV